MNKKIIALLLCLVMCVPFIATGCGSQEKEYKVYYLDIQKTSLVGQEYKPQAKSTDGLIYEFISALSTDVDSTEYMKAIPAAVSVRDYELQDGELDLYFSYQYNDLTGLDEVLTRAAIVKTLLQIKGVDSVSFYISEQPLTDSSGNVIGAMTSSTFLDYEGQDKEDLKETDLILYYASADGSSLVREDRHVYYDANVSLEKLVLDYLQKTPQTKDATATLSSKTKVRSVVINDGVCYVTLDGSLLSQMSDLSTDVIIYSIVDSLTELDGVNKVQIKMENISVTLIEQGFDLDGTYERNLNLVKQ